MSINKTGIFRKRGTSVGPSIKPTSFYMDILFCIRRALETEPSKCLFFYLIEDFINDDYFKWGKK